MRNLHFGSPSSHGPRLRPIDASRGRRAALVLVGATATACFDVGSLSAGDPPNDDASTLDAGAHDASGTDVASDGEAESSDVGEPADAAKDGSSDGAADGRAGDATSDARADAACWAASDGFPSGSYSQSCIDCSISGTTLTCKCTNDAKMEVSTSLDLCKCTIKPLSVYNDGGVLTCG